MPVCLFCEAIEGVSPTKAPTLPGIGRCRFDGNPRSSRVLMAVGGRGSVVLRRRVQREAAGARRRMTACPFLLKSTCMQNLALFDLDHTLLPIDTGYQWGRFMVARGMVDGEHFARQVEQFHADYKAGTLDMPAYLRMVLAPLAQYPRAQLNGWREQFMREVVEPAIRPEALALVRRHRDNGDLCCLVTATNDFVTAPIAAAFGIHGLVATCAKTVDGHPDSAYTGEPAGIPSFGAGKIARTEAWLASLDKAWSDFERSWFYSDSRNDIPLLERVTDPVATNPDATLRAHAQQAGWRILELFGANNAGAAADEDRLACRETAG